jgi:anti-sigma factor RsiW
MKCRDVQQLLHPYSDGELDLVRHIEIDEHLAGCKECSAQVKHLQSLRAAISSPSLYHRAPATLRARIELASRPVVRGRWRSSRHFAALAAGVFLLIGACATIGILVSRARTSAADRVAEQVVASHVRSLQVGHLTDVATSDRHTVKPWFHGKLDFSPHVPDFTAQGYTLSGGRLDYLIDRPVAAIVYLRGSHAINLFTWPTSDDAEKPTRGMARQGFNIRFWQRDGMVYWAVSDLNEQEFDEFVRLFQSSFAGSRP